MRSNTVLIVDDNPAMRQALCRLFKAAGEFQVCGEASNGAEAIEQVTALHPDVVVLDLCMPGLNGLETAPRLKELSPSTQIILYTMNAEGILEKQAFNAGVSALVSKTEGMKTFITKARRALDHSAA